MRKEKKSLLVVLFLLSFSSLLQAVIHENVFYSDESITWYAADNPHIVIGYIQIHDDAGLTIEDGCIVQFENGAYIRNYGRLTANGTAGNGIIFTRREADDEWYGIIYQNEATGSLHYCTIEYATYSTGYGVYCNNSNPSIQNCTIQNNDYGIYYTGVTSPTLSVINTIRNNNKEGLYFINCTNPSISNQTISGHSDPKGAIYMYNTGEFQIGPGNTITGNTWGLSMNIGSYPSSSSHGNIPMTGNTNDDGIQVYGGSTADSVTWHDVSADYIITDIPTVNAGGILTIEDNVNIKFETGKYLSIYGELTANGTAGNGITFTRRDADDEWYGILYQNEATGSLHYCTIEYATYYTAYGVYCNNSNPTIQNCTIQNNDYGIYCIETNPSLTDNLIQNNTETGIYFRNTINPVIGAGNVISESEIGIHLKNCDSPNFGATTVDNNTECGIYFEECNSLNTINNLTLTNNGNYGALRFVDSGNFTIDVSATIGGIGNENNYPLTIDCGSFPAAASIIPATGNTNNMIHVDGGSSTRTGTWNHFSGLNYYIDGSPDIDGNLTISAGNILYFTHSIGLYVDGTLNISGTSENRILLTRFDDTHEWSGIDYNDGSAGNLEYCTIEYATYSTGNGVYANNPDSLKLDHCILQNNDRGFYGSNASPAFVSNNEIINNNQYGIYLTGASEPTFGSELSEWNDIYGNGLYDFYNGTSDVTASYVYWGTTIQSEIDNRVYDENDSESLGLVTFIPYTNSTHDEELGLSISIPENLTIWIESDDVHLSWDAVPEATSYNIYATDDDPYGNYFLLDNTTETTWSEPLGANEKRFYYVKAVN